MEGNCQILCIGDGDAGDHILFVDRIVRFGEQMLRVWNKITFHVGYTMLIDNPFGVAAGAPPFLWR